MKTDRWITADQACEWLGVKKQTLYAYVSRGHIQAVADETDPRRSVYSALDIAELDRTHRRPRARAAIASETISWGEPVLESAITNVRNGDLYFGETLATECARSFSLEQVFDHHFCLETHPQTQEEFLRVDGANAKARAYRFLSDTAARSLHSSGRSRRVLADEAVRLVSNIADAMIGRSNAGPVHKRLSEYWGLSPKAETLVRAALVLMSDHELNASTFAVRVAASTGAPLPACLLAGLATLDGPLHGEASTQGLAYLRDAMASTEPGEAVIRHARPDGTLPGFGHPLYPAGDPRSRFLLERLPRRSKVLKAITETVRQIGHYPSADLALAAIAIEFDLENEAPFMIFSIARSVGWLAHATEQIESGQLIRPRARYKTRRS